jgi:hypothetical protein
VHQRSQNEVVCTTLDSSAFVVHALKLCCGVDDTIGYLHIESCVPSIIFSLTRCSETGHHWPVLVFNFWFVCLKIDAGEREVMVPHKTLVPETPI